MSLYTKPQSHFSGVADGVSNGGGVLRMPLNRDDFTVEHAVNLMVEHTASTAPTAAGNALHLIEKIEIETERGVEFSVAGFDLEALNEITEQASSQRVTLGTASSIEFSFELHSELDGSNRDLLTAIESGQRTKYNLILTLATDASAVLTGGTLTGTPDYTVNVEAKTYPTLSGMGAVEGSGYEGIGSLVHRVVSNTKNGTATGKIEPIQMTSAGSLLRFLQLSTFDTSGANPVVSDDVLAEVRIVAGGHTVFTSNFKNMQMSNERSRSLTRLGSGLAFADFGDDVNEFLDMGDIKDARLHLTVAAGAPASYEIRSTEDYVARS